MGGNACVDAYTIAKICMYREAQSFTMCPNMKVAPYLGRKNSTPPCESVWLNKNMVSRVSI